MREEQLRVLRKPIFRGLFAAALIAVSSSAHVSQIIVADMSLEALSAGAPIIIVARRISGDPHEFTTSDTVTRPSGEKERVSYTFTVWPFEIIETIKYGGHSLLESRIGVTRESAQQNYEVFLDYMQGISTSYVQAGYRPDPALTLDTVGTEPVILFLNRGYLHIDGASQELADAYQLYATNSLEHIDRKQEITDLSTAIYDDGNGPTLPPQVDDEQLDD